MSFKEKAKGKWLFWFIWQMKQEQTLAFFPDFQFALHFCFLSLKGVWYWASSSSCLALLESSVFPHSQARLRVCPWRPGSRRTGARLTRLLGGSCAAPTKAPCEVGCVPQPCFVSRWCTWSRPVPPPFLLLWQNGQGDVGYMWLTGYIRHLFFFMEV